MKPSGVSFVSFLRFSYLISSLCFQVLIYSYITLGRPYFRMYFNVFEKRPSFSIAFHRSFNMYRLMDIIAMHSVLCHETCSSVQYSSCRRVGITPHHLNLHSYAARCPAPYLPSLASLILCVTLNHIFSDVISYPKLIHVLKYSEHHALLMQTRN